MADAAICVASVHSRPLTAAQWNGWSPSADNRRVQPLHSAGLRASDLPLLKLKWAFAFDGATMAYGQPAIAGGLLYVGSEPGKVYALDAHTGCEKWSFQAAAGVRTGIVIGPSRRTERSPTLYFGDQKGWVYALDAATGALIWKLRADSHRAAMITGTPQLWRRRLYVPVASYEENFALDPRYPCCTFRGSILALDARRGRRLWQTYMIDRPGARTGANSAGTPSFGPSGAAIWSSPTIDARRLALYVATGNNYSQPVSSRSDSIVALDLASGWVRWSHQFTAGDAYNAGCLDFMDPKRTNCPSDAGHDFDFGSPPVLAKTAGGRDVLIAAQKSGVVYGLNPARGGAILWSRRIGQGGPLGGIEWGAAADRRKVYVALADCDWRRFQRIVDGKPATMTDLDPDKGGGLFALGLTDGTLAWRAAPAKACLGREHCSPAQLAPVTGIDGAVFSGSLDGHIRAYSTGTGKLLWDEDTARQYATVNGVPGHGGSINGAGTAVAGGWVYVSSGYSRFGEAPGNVLLAFAPASR